MKDIQIKDNDSVFNYRVTGAIIKNGKILLNRLKTDDFWTFVGGKVSMGESSEDAIVREYFEETEVDVRVKRFVAMVENFFTLNDKKWHEILIFYSLDLVDDKNIDMFEGEREIKDNHNGVIRWFDLSEIGEIKIQPECSIEILKNIYSQEIQHIITRD